MGLTDSVPYLLKGINQPIQAFFSLLELFERCNPSQIRLLMSQKSTKEFFRLLYLPSAGASEAILNGPTLELTWRFFHIRRSPV